MARKYIQADTVRPVLILAAVVLIAIATATLFGASAAADSHVQGEFDVDPAEPTTSAQVYIELTLTSDQEDIRSIEGVSHEFEQLTLVDDGADGEAEVDDDLIVWEDTELGEREQVTAGWTAVVPEGTTGEDLTFATEANIAGQEANENFETSVTVERAQFDFNPAAPTEGDNVEIAVTLTSDQEDIRAIEGISHEFENVTLEDDGAEGDAVFDAPDLIVWEGDGYEGLREEVTVVWTADVPEESAGEELSFEAEVNIDGQSETELVQDTVEITKTEDIVEYYSSDDGVEVTDAVVDWRNKEGAFSEDQKSDGSITDVIVNWRGNT